MNNHILRRVLIVVAAFVACGGAFVLAQAKFRQSSELSPGEIAASPYKKIAQNELNTSSPDNLANNSQSNSINNSTNNPTGSLLQGLNLSSEQMQQVDQIRRQRGDAMQQKRQMVQQVKAELEDLMAGKASQNQVRANYTQFKQVRQEFADMRFENTLAIREVLTPPQREKFIQKMQERREERQKLRERQNRQL
ncbi:MAG: Spy/CpxP family protein refolding chaperone [Cyanobacteria bacterium P01_A01_bin.45]